MKIKTSELSGAALDWAVAKCEGLNPDESGLVEIGTFKGRAVSVPIFYAPSQNWAQGGPIIERERIQLRDHIDLRLHWTASLHVMNSNWVGKMVSSTVFEDGPTLLVAAMRCYVASKLGDEVEVSDELTQGEEA